jgi:BirA family transcriptional regulator, biotin operon repressor / biotin---[acetyl-CoA-carboxylase] ligase
MEPAPLLPKGWRLTHVDETGSTNADALNAAREGDGGDHWFTAGRQLSGKGRQGRTWVSEPGNLYASALLIDPAPLLHISTLPFVAALALHAALSELDGMSRHELRLKWPNDVLVNRSKVSGILLEIDHLSDGHAAVAIGFGVNLAHHPDPALYTATDLKALGLNVKPMAMLERLATELDAVLEAWDRGRKFAAIRHEWLRHARGIGEPIRVNLPGRAIEGVFKDIDMDGCLLLVHKDGNQERISAGDVFFPQHTGA